MPVMNGIEATKLYRFAALGRPHVPVVALTADATEEVARRCEEAGMDACITKPIEPNRLLEIIATLVPDEGKPAQEAPSALRSPAIRRRGRAARGHVFGRRCADTRCTRAAWRQGIRRRTGVAIRPGWRRNSRHPGRSRHLRRPQGFPRAAARPAQRRSKHRCTRHLRNVPGMAPHRARGLCDPRRSSPQEAERGIRARAHGIAWAAFGSHRRRLTNGNQSMN